MCSWPHVDLRVLERALAHDLVPERHRVHDPVGLRRRRHVTAPPGGQLEGVVDDPRHARAREHGLLHGHLSGGSRGRSARRPRCTRPPRSPGPPRSRRRAASRSGLSTPSKTPDRAQVDVLAERAPDRDQQAPQRHVVGHAGRADGAEQDRVELAQALQPVRRASSPPRARSARRTSRTPPTGSRTRGGGRPPRARRGPRASPRGRCRHRGCTRSDGSSTFATFRFRNLRAGGTQMTRWAIAGAVLALMLAPAPVAAAHPRAKHTISWDRYSFVIDGKREWLWSGEFHYFRLPNPDLWRDQLEKLKAERLQHRLAVLQLGLPLPRARRLRLHRRARHRPAARHRRRRRPLRDRAAGPVHQRRARLRRLPRPG